MPRQQTPVKTWIIAVLAVLVIGQAGYFLFVLPEQERSHIAEIEQQVQQQSAVPPLAREASDPPHQRRHRQTRRQAWSSCANSSSCAMASAFPMCCAPR